LEIVGVKQLAIPDIKAVRFARFCDHRGYFTEHFRKSDFGKNPSTAFLAGLEWLQTNESFSRKGTVRGLHFQWNPYMGKLVRTLHGHMIDLVLDIRKGSPTFGKIIAHDMPCAADGDWGEWIWVPPGFAHGTCFPADGTIEYFCSGEYSQGCEAGISPLAKDIDWSLCDPALRKTFQEVVGDAPLITDKDRNALTVAAWAQDERSQNFVYHAAAAAA